MSAAPDTMRAMVLSGHGLDAESACWVRHERTRSAPMKINALTVWHVALTSHETYHMAAGKTCDTVDTMVLRGRHRFGLSGWGEVCPIPHYLPAYAGGVIPAIAEMAPVSSSDRFR
jgi:hypothetical protein